MNIDYRKLMRKKARKRVRRGLVHRCVTCGREYPHEVLNRCPDDGGAIDVFYDLGRVRIQDVESPLERYFDLLPIEDPENLLWGGEGNTPCFRATELEKKLGHRRIYLKDETRNPTLTTKDRIASMGLSYFKELGVDEFVISSTGNSSTAFARGAQLFGNAKVHIFAGRDWLYRLNYPDHPQVMTYVVDDDFVAAGKFSQEFAKVNGLLSEGGFFNLARREGLKLAYLEAYDQMDRTPEYVFQAVSSGMGLLGGYKGALEYLAMGRLSRLPRFTAVQQATCAPMAGAYQEGLDHIEPRHVIKNPKGLAHAILRGDPRQAYPYIHHVVTASEGSIESVNNEEIIAARNEVLECEGLHICFSAATAVAGMAKLIRTNAIPKGAPLLVNITGADRPVNPVPKSIIPYRQAAEPAALQRAG